MKLECAIRSKVIEEAECGMIATPSGLALLIDRQQLEARGQREGPRLPHSLASESDTLRDCAGERDSSSFPSEENGMRFQLRRFIGCPFYISATGV